jgi:hypothetical protein
MALKYHLKKSYKINSSFALNIIGRNNNKFVWGNMVELQNVFFLKWLEVLQILLIACHKYLKPLQKKK